MSLSDSSNWLYYNGHGDLAVETSTSTTSSATPTTVHSYDPFGTPLDSTTSNGSDVSANGTTERYTSRWDKKLDISTNLVHMGARPYSPDLGRFLTVDPVLGGSCNTYDYACQDPINAYDLDGESFCRPCDRLGEAIESNPATAKISNIGGWLRRGNATASKAVATYGPACGTGALTGAWAGGHGGAAAGCALGVGIQAFKNIGGGTGRIATGVDIVLTLVDIRRGAYKHLGIQTYREIVEMYKTQTR